MAACRGHRALHGGDNHHQACLQRNCRSLPCPEVAGKWQHSACSSKHMMGEATAPSRAASCGGGGKQIAAIIGALAARLVILAFGIGLGG